MTKSRPGIEFLEPSESHFRVPFDGTFRVKKAPTRPPRKADDNGECKKQLKRVIDRLDEHQRVLYAQDHHAILCIFQAIDAAGKDSTIRAVTSGLNPAGFQVFSFKAPSAEELDHDFLWRTTRRLPERGRIGIFNRSYYEEVLVVRVHPKFLDGQRLPQPHDHKNIWKHRFESIREHERHLARNGTVILKFWLNVSKDEQRRRFIDRIHKQKKNWKFSESDVDERQHWDAYMQAFEECLNATSTSWAPWYAIPADSKPFMRLTVAQILERTLTSMGLKYPTLNAEQREALQNARQRLERET
jgi:PPK2 family polyphosphate:nucleotide phosphotransferase